MKVLSALSRFGTLVMVVGIVLALTNPLHGSAVLGGGGFALILVSLVLVFAPVRMPHRAPVRLDSPVTGRWVPVNSPADKVPSHGTHELGQTYAIDLVHVPDPDAEWKPVHRSPLMARPETFPAFGRPVTAPADGVVVAASGWQRDHWSRNSWPALAYLMVEGMVFRSLLSLATLSAGRFVIGNHVILKLDDGSHAVLAHLRRGSVTAAKGQRVRAGELLGEVGNSGNSSEPHLHFHLMDRARPGLARGVPFEFAYRDAAGEERVGVPGGRAAFVAPALRPAQTAEAQPGIG